jgi:hypothetical protein
MFQGVQSLVIYSIILGPVARLNIMEDCRRPAHFLAARKLSPMT